VVHGDSLKAVLETLAAMAWEDVTVELQDSGAVLARAGEQ
jgi:hypothetical protein